MVGRDSRGTSSNVPSNIGRQGQSPSNFPVKKLTKEIISETIEAYASEEAYWLKLYHFAGKIDTAVFN